MHVEYIDNAFAAAAVRATVGGAGEAKPAGSPARERRSCILGGAVMPSSSSYLILAFYVPVAAA